MERVERCVGRRWETRGMKMGRGGRERKRGSERDAGESTPRAMVKKFFDKKCGVWAGPGFLILDKKFSGSDSGEDSGEDSGDDSRKIKHSHMSSKLTLLRDLQIFTWP